MPLTSPSGGVAWEGAVIECGWSSPEAISACVATAQSWLKTVGDLVGLGSAALLTILAGYILQLRRESAKQEAVSSERFHRAKNAELAQHQFDARIASLTEDRNTLEREKTDLADRVRLLTDSIRANAAASETVHEALEISRAGDTAFWRRPPLPLHDAGLPLQLRTSCPTLMFANQKGGVGKSTLVSNLAAYYATKGLNILAVDLDYQGSLTNQMRLQQFGPQGAPFGQALDAKTVLGQPFRKADWPKGQLDQAIITATSNIPPQRPGVPSGRLCYLANNYELSQVERAVEYSWVLNMLDDDPRYRLAAFLSHAAQELGIDYILIDAPPRFTLGFINGLAASTHLFVPTVVDAPSAQAVETFARQFADTAPRLNPTLRWAGIIGTMTTGKTSALPQPMMSIASSTEFAARNRIPNAGPFFRDATIPRTTQISQAAALGIPFLQSAELREGEIIQTLGERILDELGKDGNQKPSGLSTDVEHASTA